MDEYNIINQDLKVQLQKKYQENHKNCKKNEKSIGFRLIGSSRGNSLIRILGILSIIYFVYTIILYILAYMGLGPLIL